MSNRGGLKAKTSGTSLGHNKQLQQSNNDITVQNSCSELFELKAKPKLTCIPESCRKLFNDLRKTQSLNVTKMVEYPEKSFSVLYIGSKTNAPKKRLIM